MVPNSYYYNASVNYTVQSMISVYDIQDLTNIKFKKAVSNYSWIKSITEQNISKLGYDTNHNFSIAKIGSRDFLAVADYVDGVAAFDITDGL